MLNTVLAFLPAGGEWIVIALVALLIFGGKKIPELMHGVGKGIRSFKEGMNGTDEKKEDDKLNP
ncbi:MAG: twin-arginine translocase TatA/TatE family subunit [Bacteroidetes bacterium]|jgi:sec-independent protein translocase protein TatA|nr:twin-arginine translocase TatA/TatE family subunit [Bacteroidota bacterium]